MIFFYRDQVYVTVISGWIKIEGVLCRITGISGGRYRSNSLNQPFEKREGLRSLFFCALVQAVQIFMHHARIFFHYTIDMVNICVYNIHN